MKNLNYLNYFFVGTPLALILVGYISNDGAGDLMGIGLLLSMLTGIFQVIVGFKMLMEEPKSKALQIYIISVIVFFLILFISPILNNDRLFYILIPVPPILAIYFSVLIYTKQQS